jgi:hypothetical protein
MSIDGIGAMQEQEALMRFKKSREAVTIFIECTPEDCDSLRREQDRIANDSKNLSDDARDKRFATEIRKQVELGRRLISRERQDAMPIYISKKAQRDTLDRKLSEPSKESEDYGENMRRREERARAQSGLDQLIHDITVLEATLQADAMGSGPAVGERISIVQSSWEARTAIDTKKAFEICGELLKLMSESFIDPFNFFTLQDDRQIGGTSQGKPTLIAYAVPNQQHVVPNGYKEESYDEVSEVL